MNIQGVIVMSVYIASVISAAILSGAASLLSPDSWRKYVGMITGIVILATIIAPLSRISVSEVFSSFNEPVTEQEISDGEQFRLQMIEDELTGRINTDIENRMRDEFNIKVHADAEIGVDSGGKITGVKKITVDRSLPENAKQRLCEVYGVKGISVE